MHKTVIFFQAYSSAVLLIVLTVTTNDNFACKRAYKIILRIKEASKGSFVKKKNTKKHFCYLL
jgi:hypothetical protein